MKNPRGFSNFDVSLILSVVVFFTILSFQNYFFLTPFQNGFNVLSTLQFVLVIGWITLIFAPPFFFRDSGEWSIRKLYLFYFTVVVYLISVTGIKIYTLSVFGAVYTEYLFATPILFLLEWVLPGFYIYIARKQWLNHVLAELDDENTQRSSESSDQKLF
jgi:hypothetical protein